MTAETLLTHCEILKKNESFAWWLRVMVTEPMEEADRRRSDLSLSESDRTHALVEWLRLKKQADYLAETEITARRTLPPLKA